METILGLILIALMVTLIVGLVKPEYVLKWSKKPTRLKVIGYWFLALLVLGGIASGLDDSEEDKNQTSVQESKAVDDIEEEKDPETTLKEQLEREITSIDEGINFTIYSGSVDALLLEVGLFSEWAELIKKAESSNDEIKQLAQTLKQKVQNIQKKEFPRLRNEYVNLSAKRLWEENIEVTSIGTGNKYINYTGAIFANNKNKKIFQEEIHSTLMYLRFSRSYYKWFEYDDKAVYYTIFEGNDSDLID